MASAEPEDGSIKSSGHGSGKILRSAHSSGMESSILRFKGIYFVVGKGETERAILNDVSGRVKWGHVLAIMGPSGAGKTTLINALTLDAHYGKAIGNVTLNGVPMTDTIFREHCYVVVQHDKHWPFLTARETLRYCAELYDVAAPEDLDAVVQEIITKMGMESAADTRNSSLSGGQRRRLSIGIALLKQPTLLFLDEPTSGLDAAAASSIMQEIVRVAREERIIIICTIHQPSTKVYNGFDQIMIMSRGREAFSGDSKEAIPYFESIGHPCPPATNPAEFFLDLVNGDFSPEEEINRILDTWEERRPEAHSTHHKKGFDGDDDDDAQEGVVSNKRLSLGAELSVMFRRHSVMIIRDPVLYIGRCFVFLMANIVFALVYLKARDNIQDQAINKMWVSIWFIGVPSNMGVVAVYALNDEFKSVLRERKNGMVTGLSYVFTKSLLVLPILFIFAFFSLGIPAFVIQDVPGEAFGMLLLLFVCTMFVFESLAECLSVWFDDPILGMLQFMNFWFGAFLFGGFLIPSDDLYWPFELFFYIMPYGYYVRSNTYELFSTLTFESCPDPSAALSAVCVDSTDGLDVLGSLSRTFPLLSTKKYTAQDMIIIVVIGLVYKFFYIVGVLYKTSLVAKFHDEPYVPPVQPVASTPAAAPATTSKEADAPAAAPADAPAAAPAIKSVGSAEKYEDPSAVSV